ncbi:hypothetical protein [Caulobacter endophyticus]|uniref:Uncharacterized protein n=1 Tax=Caulobacter endophyticus TaxID=2172652 RepID=A0A2T9KE09_9CAUL|nr:hypothetical protein [Caulobacter endophyticus]PVM94225.1 hypothetical protein DDF67_00150 [Caulobacter endophyticus]
MRRILATTTATCLALAASAASAQTDALQAQERAASRMEVEALRQQQMAAAREAQAARDRAATAQTLRALQGQGASAGQPYRPPPAMVLPERGDPTAGLSPGLGELDRLTDARLARSNEVLRAIKPASER